jgi:protein ImuB
MRRVVSRFLPAWPSDRLRRTLGGAVPLAEAPLVLGVNDLLFLGHIGLSRDAEAARSGLGSRFGSMTPDVQPNLN